MLITIPQLRDVELFGGLIFDPGRRKARRVALASFRSYGVAASPPLNTANSTSSYGTNGSSYTSLSNILNEEPSGRLAKVIERRRKGVTYVEKFTARIDHGKLKVTMEYGSALCAVFDAYFLAKTKIYYKIVNDDTGGTAGSQYVFYGPIESMDAPATPGDDADEEFSFTMAVETATFTAGS